MSAHRALGFALALGMDAVFGDPPNTAHPVAWFGRLARFVEAQAPGEPGRRGRFGALAAVGLVTAAAATAHLARPRLRARRGGARAVVEGASLWLACSRRTLLARAGEVAAALERDDLEEARRLLAWHLVSRDTSTLDASEVAGAAIESVAENLSDGTIAPWCWYALAGAPGAWGYRALNTLDAMWGYRTPPYEEFGRTAARADDLANLVPSRVTVLAILVAGGRGEAWETWRRDAGTTSSPNAGHPMAAMAGVLGVELTKRGEYRLGAGGRGPTVSDLRRAIEVARVASWYAAGVLGMALTWRAWRAW